MSWIAQPSFVLVHAYKLMFSLSLNPAHTYPHRLASWNQLSKNQPLLCYNKWTNLWLVFPSLTFSKERERIRSWVNKEIHRPPPPKAGPQSSSTSSANAFLGSAPPAAVAGGGATSQGDQRKSPVPGRKLAKQKTPEPAVVSTQKTKQSSSQSGQLQAPLLPERVGQAATASANGTRVIINQL